MPKDRNGLEVTTDAPAAVAAIDRFTQRMLGYVDDASVILDAVEADPEAPLPNALAAALFLFLETADAPRRAYPYLAAARRTAARGSARERLIVDAIDAWWSGRPDRAAAIHQELAHGYPKDVLSAKIGQYHRFNLGDGPGIRKLAELILPANADNHFVHGMLAFGLEQTHDLRAAERHGRHALAIDRNDPWAQHAVAHVMETQGRVEEGIPWLKDFADTWAGCNSFMQTHNWWHLALFHLDRDEPDQALALFDRRIWGVWKDYSQDQINAVSLLIRLELRGVEVGDRWTDVASYLRTRLHDHVNAFLDVQYIYGLARAGLDAEGAEMHASMIDHARRMQSQGNDLWIDVAVPVAEAMIAHARGRHQTVVETMTPVLPRLVEMGGSHAQRDLFAQIHLDALLQAGYDDAARRILAYRIAARPGIGHPHRTMAAVYDRLGMTAAAKGARASARRCGRKR